MLLYQKKFFGNWILILACVSLCINSLSCRSLNPGNSSQSDLSNEKHSKLGKHFPSNSLRRLVLGLDGVSHSTMLKLYQGGYFRQFFEPSPMVASFPSISDPNWNRLLQTPVSEGYTKAHVNTQVRTNKGLGQIRGNLIDHLSETHYEKSFDFKAEGVIQHIASVTWIETSALYWLDSLSTSILNFEGEKETYFAFIVNTDLLSHVNGERALMTYLSEVDRKLAQLQLRFKKTHQRNLEITIVSDHGNSYVSNGFEMVQFREPLTKKGWSFSESLNNPKDVVFVAPEILSFGAFYTSKIDSPQFAQDLSLKSGVHVTLYESKPHQIEVLQQGGQNHLQIVVDPKNKTVHLKVEKGEDPFSHAALFSDLPIPWDVYFHKTLKTDYPNAAIRAWEAFHRNAQMPATVLASTKLGWAFENPTLKILTNIRGLKSMHGSLERSETLGVFMSTERETTAIRPDDFGQIISLKDFGTRSP